MSNIPPSSSPNNSTEVPAIRATARLMPDATPACGGSTAGTVVVRVRRRWPASARKMTDGNHDVSSDGGSA